MLVAMVAGEFIVGVCAAGGLIACLGFGWAARTGQFSAMDEAKYLVFDEGDDPRLSAGTTPSPLRPSAPPSPRP
jgi:nitrogen fixation-related uncharacterized protein